MLEPKIVEFQTLGDARGSLVALETGKQVPFDIKRAYYIFDTKAGVRRGFHAHKKLQQVAVCVRGACSFLLDDGTDQVTVRLDRPSMGLYIGAMLWREMFDFTDDCVLLVLADEVYDESDYIRSHADFLRSLSDSSAE
jgi:dTDP-4-dehydrorhamnose 3,5-epimerase-like enzyme